MKHSERATLHLPAGRTKRSEPPLLPGRKQRLNVRASRAENVFDIETIEPSMMQHDHLYNHDVEPSPTSQRLLKCRRLPWGLRRKKSSGDQAE